MKPPGKVPTSSRIKTPATIASKMISDAMARGPTPQV